jgi:hypothetical protein
VESSEVTVSIKPSPSQGGSAPATAPLGPDAPALARLSIDSSDAEGDREDANAAVTPTAANIAAHSAAAGGKGASNVPMSAQERLAKLSVRSSPTALKAAVMQGKGKGQAGNKGEGDREPNSHP